METPEAQEPGGNIFVSRDPAAVDPSPGLPRASAHESRRRRIVIVGLVLAVLLCSISQLCWKQATMGVAENAGTLATLATTITRPIFWLAAALYVWQFFNWMMVLKYADLSFAQPLTALTYVVVCTVAHFIWNESLPPHRILGIVLILAGVAFISRSPYYSASPKKVASLPGEGRERL